MFGGMAAWAKGARGYPPEQEQPAPAAFPIHRNAVLVAAVAWVGVLIVIRQCALFWWGSTLGLLAAWAWLAGTAQGLSPMGKLTRCSLWIVLLLCVAAACVTLIANRPDADDAFYQSIAANLIRFPTQPLLARDTLHHITSMPILCPDHGHRDYFHRALRRTRGRCHRIGWDMVTYG
jgi:hypothetical protein